MPTDRRELRNLAAVKRTRLSDRAADELKRLLCRGDYPSGSRLPSEKELAAALGVTRLTVREALAQLEASGLTEARHGSGTYVVDLNHKASFRALEEMLSVGRALDSREVLGLLQFREVVVLGFLDAIAAGITPEQLSNLRTRVAAERQAGGDVARLAALDLEINEILAEASGNHFYRMLLASLHEAHLKLAELVFRAVGDVDVVIRTHAAVVEALAGRDAASLRHAMEVYLRGATSTVSEWLARPQ